MLSTGTLRSNPKQLSINTDSSAFSGQPRLSDYVGRTTSKAMVSGHLRATRPEDMARSSKLERAEDTLLAKLNAKRKQQLKRGSVAAGEILSPRSRGARPTSPKASIHSSPRGARGAPKLGHALPAGDNGLQVAEAESNRLANPVDAKEDMLEQIMSAEAYQSFELMARYQLNRNVVTRVAMAADRLRPADVKRMSMEVGHRVEEVSLSDSDDELVETWGLSKLKIAAEDTERRRAATGRNRNLAAVSGLLPSDYGLACGYYCPVASDIRTASWRSPLDAMFAARCGAYRLVGIVNSHGSADAGYSLTQMIAEEMPTSIFRSPHLCKAKDPRRALTSAFQRVHYRACKALDLVMTGAAVTVLLMDESDLWTAHVGDCRAVLGTKDMQDNATDDHFCAEPLIGDHKLSSAQEFDRIVAAGGDVRRLVGDNSHRLFVQDADLPGLVLTRAVGDGLGHAVGVTHVPTITSRKIQDIPTGSFIVLGSGSLWTTTAERAVVNRVGRNFSSPEDAAKQLGDEALARWEDPSTLSRLCLRQDEPESFSVMVLFLAEEVSVQVASLADK